MDTNVPESPVYTLTNQRAGVTAFLLDIKGGLEKIQNDAVERCLVA